MTNIRRYFEPNQLSFQTHVTKDRVPILVDHFNLLWDAISSIQREFRFDVVAWGVLPDHVHLLIDLKSTNAISIARQFKLRFSAAYRSKHGLIGGRIWQSRFWDHAIRDEEDLRRHIEYIHYNPVKHGVTTSAMDMGIRRLRIEDVETSRHRRTSPSLAGPPFGGQGISTYKTLDRRYLKGPDLQANYLFTQ